VTNPNVEQHHTTTLAVLAELGAGNTTTLTVFNKVDAATPEMISQARRLSPDALFVSAHTRQGLDDLESRCLELIADAHQSVELFIPHSRYDVVSRLHAVGHVQSEEQEDEGVRLHGRYPAAQASFFAPFVVKS
jgi:GTP-binding protein HflX